MFITNKNYIQALRQLKQRYSDLPWYQRWWFSLWSYNLSSALSAIDFDNPTREQVNNLYRTSDKAWVFNSIFGLLTQFKEVIGTLSLGMQPKDIKEKISEWLTEKDLFKLATTTKTEFQLFKPKLDAIRFIFQVANGEYEKVGAKQKKNINLLLQKVRFTDLSGRTFFNISSFQYALWALDKHMWIKMLNCLPQNEEGENLKTKLLEQYQEIKQNGVTYEVNGEIITENHFDFENTIIKELSNLRFLLFNSTQSEKINKQWREGVGAAQRKLPMHVVYEYCSKQSFDPVPEFIEQPLMRKGFLDRYGSSSTENYTDWFQLNTGLGSKFAIFKHWSGQAYSSTNNEFEGYISQDLFAMQTLYKVRTANFLELELLLKEPLGFDNHLHVSHYC